MNVSPTKELQEWSEWTQGQLAKHPRRSIKQVSRRYCVSQVSKNIGLTMREWKKGSRWVSPQQAIAVGYSLARRATSPRCDTFIVPAKPKKAKKTKKTKTTNQGVKNSSKD